MADHPEQSSEPASLRARVAELEALTITLNDRCEHLQQQYQNLPLAYQSLNAAGCLIEVNQVWLNSLGYSRDEVVGKPFAHFLQPHQQEHFQETFPRLKAPGEVLGGEFEMLRKDGSVLFVSINGSIERDAQGLFLRTNCIFQDITQQKKLEERHEAERELLQICQLSTGIDDLIHQLVLFFQRLTDCEAVGVRLRRNEDFPYYETLGFPEPFVRAENSLCAHDVHGELVRDSRGDPVLECMCGNILCGRFDPTQPFFTTNGSFWTNSTSKLLATTSENDRQARTRNRCNGQGYESVALIPLRSQASTFGIFQFNDRRSDRFSPERVEQLEHLADYTALSLAKHLADQELRNSEEKYRLVVENAREAIVITQDEHLILVNPAAVKLGGYPIEQLSAKPFTEFIHPEDRQMVSSQYTRRLRGEDVPSSYGFRLICQDGQVKWLEAHGSLVEWNGNTATLSFLTDITEHRLADIQRKESELILKAILNASPETILLLDSDGQTLLANQAAAKRLNKTADELIGRNVFDFFSPEIAAQRKKWRQQVIDTGQPISFQDERNGMVLESHLWPIADQLGRVSRIAVFSLDISERKRAEKQLIQGHALLKNLAHQVPGVIYQYRLYPDGRSAFPYASPGMNDIYEVAPGDVQEDATPIFGRLHPDDHDRVAETIFESARTLETFYCEFRVILPRQGLRWRWSQAQPQRMEDGGTLWHGIISDITERKQAEEEKKNLSARLQQAQKMEAIGTLAGGIAHDFNNILGAILGYAEIAVEDCEAGSALEGDIEQIIKAGTRAKELVKQILAFSRQADTNQIPLQPAVIITEAMKLLRASLPSTITISQDVDPGSGLILADPTQIHQLIMNLCTNAFHAMEVTGGSLSISLKRKKLTGNDLSRESQARPGDFVHIAVGDTGSGMAPEILEKIFDPYFTTKEVGKGTGMGLSIVHGIVQSYGGVVQCRSRIDKGTVFDVYLPVSKDATVSDDKLNDLVRHGNERILLVDDEEMLAEMGKNMLTRLGYRVTARTNSILALNTFENQPEEFDLVITDQTMPGMTGSDLARRMLQIRPDLPVILCTGYSNLISEDRARSIGIQGFAMKPLTQKEISLLIRTVLGRNRSV